MGRKPKGDTCSVTPMQNGRFRAECLVVYPSGMWCGWWFDSLYSDLASKALREHMKEAHRMRNVNTKALP